MIEHYSKNIQSHIKEELSSASSSIKIAVAWFTNAKLFLKLISKLLTGVSVELILNKDEINCSEDNEIDFQDFLNAGGVIHWNDPKVKLMHEKFCVIDNSVVIFGSYNWTNKADYNQESIIIARDETNTVQFYSELFDSLCQQSPAEENAERKSFKQDTFYTSADCLFETNGVKVLKKKNEDNGKEVYRLYHSETKQKITSFDYDNILFHNDNNDKCIVAVKKGIIWYFFNVKGKYLIEDVPYQDIQIINNYNAFWILRNGKWGIMRNDGKIILGCSYDTLSIKNTKCIITKQSNKYGIFDWKIAVWNCVLDSVELLHDEIYKIEKSGKFGVANRDLIVVECKYDSISHVIDNQYIVSINSHYGLIDGNSVCLPCLYDKIVYKDSSPYSDRIYILQENGKYGLFYNGILKLECVYDELNLNATIPSLKSNKKGVINSSGEIVIPFQYSEIKYCSRFNDDPYYAYREYYILSEIKKQKKYYGVYITETKTLGICNKCLDVLLTVPGFDGNLFNQSEHEVIESLRISYIKTMLFETVHPSLLSAIKDQEERNKKWKECDKEQEIKHLKSTMELYKRFSSNPVRDTYGYSKRYIEEQKEYNRKCYESAVEKYERALKTPVYYKNEYEEKIVALSFSENNSFNVGRRPILTTPFEKNDVIELPKKPKVICESIGGSLQTFIVAKIVNKDTSRIRYIRFNPSMIKRSIWSVDEAGKRIKLESTGSAFVIAKSQMNSDDIYSCLTKGYTQMCKINISEIKKVRKYTSNKEDLEYDYLYAYDVLK